MKRLIRQLVILFVLGYPIYTFISTDYGTPEKELEHIIMEYADKGDVTGVEVSLDQERVLHSNNNVLKTPILKMVRGGVIDMTFWGTIYNENKNLAVVDCSIVRQGEDGSVTNRNYFFMCYDKGIGWSIYDILGYSNANQNDSYDQVKNNGKNSSDPIKSFNTDDQNFFEEKNNDFYNQTDDYSNGVTNDLNNDAYADSEKDASEDNLFKFDDRAARFADCTEQEILDAVAEHYYTKHGVSDVLARLDSKDGDIWLIQVYEDMGDHESTCDWYTIDRVVVCGTTMFGLENVDLASLLNRDPVYIFVEDASELSKRHGYRADGTSIEYYTASSYDTNEVQPDFLDRTNDIANDSGSYSLSEGKYYAGYEDGQILPGTYGLKVEGDMSKYYAGIKIHHLHSVIDSYTLGSGNGGADLLFNNGLLDFYVDEGDCIEYSIFRGEPTVTIFLK